MKGQQGFRAIVVTYRSYVAFFPDDAPARSRPGCDLVRGLAFSLLSLSLALLTATVGIEVFAGHLLSDRSAQVVYQATSLLIFAALVGVMCCSGTALLPPRRHGEDEYP